MVRGTALVTLILTLGAFAVPSRAEELGSRLYLRYCSDCHGPIGKGDGIIADLMTPRPIDLTQLAKKAGGKFPFYEVVGKIDGRETIRAHGAPDMPVWGEAFEKEDEGLPNAQAVGRSKVILITTHIETLQQK
jgi:mono/diheme cytochrome c family protein